jgi:hypothetical protein
MNPRSPASNRSMRPRLRFTPLARNLVKLPEAIRKTALVCPAVAHNIMEFVSDLREK